MLFVAVAAGAGPLARAAPAHRGVSYVLLHLALTAVMLGAWATSTAGVPGARRWTLAAGVLARLVLVAVPPFTTDDVARYLWDGRVVLAGLDPYQLPPSAPALADVRAVWPMPQSHLAIGTLYPPGALALFALVAAAGPARAFIVWKVLVTLAALATLGLVAALLRREGREQHLPLVALSPLLVLEGGVGAHVDAFPALGVAAALYWFAAGRAGAAGAALGLGALAKLLPATALVPAVAAAEPRPARRLAAAAVAVLVAGYGLAVALGLRPLGSGVTFFTGARFGSPLFAAVEAAFGTVATWTVVAAGLGAMLALAAFLARALRPVVGMQVALAAPVVFAPLVLPWYLMPLVPGLALAPSAGLLAWMTTLPLTYEVNDGVAATGTWAPARWPLVVIAGACALGFALDVARRRRRTPRPAPAPAAGIAVVIPVLDEAARIGRRLDEVRAIRGIAEVIVVDGGSRDPTVDLVRRYSDVRLVIAPRGRGPQMNAGARAAAADVLLFLHADVALPADAAAWVAAAVAEPGVVAGAFRTWTVPDDEGARRPWLAPLLGLADLRSRWTRLPYGDQALFVRRAAFERAGGFPDQPLLEDLELSRRLRRLGRIVTVPATVRVSGRRFLAAPVRAAVAMRVFPLLYRLGVPARTLARLYGNPR